MSVMLQHGVSHNCIFLWKYGVVEISHNIIVTALVADWQTPIAIHRLF
jgi:hypothetical protein